MTSPGKFSRFFSTEKIPPYPGLRRRAATLAALLALWIFVQLAGIVLFLLFRGIAPVLWLSAALFLLEIAAAAFMDRALDRETKRSQWRISRADWRLVNVGFLFFTGGVLALEALSRFVFEWCGLSFSPMQDLAQILLERPFSECVLVAALSVLLAPVAEELVFRRVLFGTLLPLGATAAALIAAAVFSAAHFFPVGAASLFWGALVLQHFYGKSGRVIVPMLIHAFANLCTILTLLIARFA